MKKTKEKNVLCIMTIWNEMDYLPLKVQYCKDNDLDIYIIDNMSNDGSWEWLQKNNIPSHRFDTNESFDLRGLQNEMVRTLHLLKPYWVIYNGCDLFPISKNKLYEDIMEEDKKGFNILKMDLCGVFNTGEEHNKFNPFNTYFYCGNIKEHNKIHKYHPNVSYFADNVNLPNPKIGKLEGIMINYGNSKPAEEREATLKRREKAWRNGEPRGHGIHYLRNKALNWVRNKEELIDLRNTKYSSFLKKLQSIGDKVLKDV